jgi:hypothetical protein
VQSCTRYSAILAQACQHLWLVPVDDVYRWVDARARSIAGLFPRSPSEPDWILIASSGSPVSLFPKLWPITLASVLDNVQDRFGCSHLAYLDVLSMGNLPHFAVGVFFLLLVPIVWTALPSADYY